MHQAFTRDTVVAESRDPAVGGEDPAVGGDPAVVMAWPWLQALRGKAEDIRQSELDKALSKLGDGMTKKQLKAVEELSRGIVNKLLHGPMTALRCDGSDPAAVGETLANMDALERMFELSRLDMAIKGRQ